MRQSKVTNKNRHVLASGSSFLLQEPDTELEICRAADSGGVGLVQVTIGGNGLRCMLIICIDSIERIMPSIRTSVGR
jgi:hypothetical protein